jgi:TMEM175 potassium channel family protein
MAEPNPNSRLEAFCDGVFAIAITLLILDVRIPSEGIETSGELWLALKHALPSIYAFVLSFTIILITWVNHHGTLKMVNKSSALFFFANGFLLLTVVFLPFPSSLLGEYLSTDHSSPAVVVYVLTLALQAIGWILLTGAVSKGELAKDEESARALHQRGTYGYFGLIVYILCAIAAFRFPLTIALVTTAIWIFWLILGLRFKHE